MEQLNLSTSVLSALKKARLLEPASIVEHSHCELRERLGLSAKEVTSVLTEASSSLLTHPPFTAQSLASGEGCSQNLQRRWLTTGCPVLDKFLRGGVYSQGITEVAGESAAGKTQLCLQLSITAQLSVDRGGLDGGTLYVCAEDAFPHRRLTQMVTFLQRRCQDEDISRHCFTDNIYIEHTADVEALRYCVSRKAPVLLEKKLIQFIVVDSIAALFRGEYANEMTQRAKMLSEIGSQLNTLSIKHNIPVVCVNQVSSVVSDNTQSQPSQLRPALGLVWSHLVSTRLMVTRTPQFLVARTPCDSAPQVNVRHMEVLFAPHLPSSICRYIIDQDGVKGLS